MIPQCVSEVLVLYTDNQEPNTIAIGYIDDVAILR